MPERIGQYDIIGRIAVGGMAEIFLGRLTRPGGFSKTVVIKQLLPHLAKDRDCVAMMQDEARVAALLDHANIVQVFDFGEDGGSFYIAMEYLVGEDLAAIATQCRSRDKAMPVPELLCVISAVAAALRYAHDLKGADGVPLDLVHRDVTPRNIVVTDQGVVKLVDFGIARARTRSLATEPGSVRGNRMFIAPEYVRGDGLDRRADIYALGLTMIDVLAGQLPFDDDHLARLVSGAAKVPLLSTLVPGCDPALEAVIAKATALDPTARYQTAAELQSAVDELRRAPGMEADSAALSRLLMELFGSEHFASQRSRGQKLTPQRISKAALSASPWRRLGWALAAAGGVTATAGAWLMSRGEALGPEPVPPPTTLAPPPPPPPLAPPPATDRPVVPRGKLSLDCELPLRVRLGTENLGITPISDLSLPAGTHRLQLSSGEHGIATTREVTVRAGGSHRETVVLGKAKLWIESNVPAEIWIANRKIGVTPLAAFPYWEGRYTVLLVDPASGAEKKRDIVLAAGSEVRLSVELGR